MRLRHLAVIAGALTGAAGARLPAQRCGVERWAVKTGADPDAQQVDLANPKRITIARLAALPAPHPIPASGRSGAPERTVYVVDATLTDYKFEGGSHGDSDYHLVLQDDSGRTMIAEIPSPACVDSTSRFRTQIARARTAFDAKLTPTSSFQTANVAVEVTGVALFDFPHGQHGAAPNEIELHPVLDIVFNPVQGPDFILALSSPTISVPQGGSSSIRITSTSASGSPVDVALQASGAPTGVATHVTALADGVSMLAVSATAATPTGSYPVTVTATAGERSHSQVVSLDVTVPGQTPEVQEWEYRVISATSEQDVIDQANRLGAEQWEMVAVVRVSGSPAWRAFFKRPKRDF